MELEIKGRTGVKKSISRRRQSLNEENREEGGGTGVRGMGVGDHRSLLIHPDYKVRLRLSDMGKSCLSSFSSSLPLSHALAV